MQPIDHGRVQRPRERKPRQLCDAVLIDRDDHDSARRALRAPQREPRVNRRPLSPREQSGRVRDERDRRRERSHPGKRPDPAAQLHPTRLTAANEGGPEKHLGCLLTRDRWAYLPKHPASYASRPQRQFECGGVGRLVGEERAPGARDSTRRTQPPRPAAGPRAHWTVREDRMLDTRPRRGIDRDAAMPGWLAIQRPLAARSELRVYPGVAGHVRREALVGKIWASASRDRDRGGMMRNRVTASGRAASRVPGGPCWLAGIVAAVLIVAPAQASAADFTWSGAVASPLWSDGGNWAGGTAPSQPVGTLSFPALTSKACTGGSPPGSCYTNVNDINGLIATGLSIDDGEPYVISGNGITLGSGGLTATTTSTGAGQLPNLTFPITLVTPQTWSVSAGGLSLGGPVTGNADIKPALVVKFPSKGSNNAFLDLNGTHGSRHSLGHRTRHARTRDVPERDRRPARQLERWRRAGRERQPQPRRPADDRGRTDLRSDREHGLGQRRRHTRLGQ